MLLSTRDADPSDRDWLWGTYKKLLQPSVEEQWGWDETFQVNEIFERLVLSKFKIISEGNLDIAAYLTYNEPDHYYVKMILVLEKYQGSGIGRGIIENIQESAVKNGKLVKLSVINANPVIGFYKKLGFCIVSEGDGSTNLCWGL